MDWKTLGVDLRSIAMLNPRLALMLTRGQPLAPRAYNIRIQFDQGTSGETIDSEMDERLYQDVWIQNLAYTVRRPNANEGVIDRAQVDEYTKLNPYVDVEMRVAGTEKYELTNSLTPLENIAQSRNVRDYLNKAWTLGVDQNLKVRGVLQRNLAEDELPYLVILTLTVIEVSGCNLHTIAYADAVCALKTMGIYPSFKDVELNIPKSRMM